MILIYDQIKNSKLQTPKEFLHLPLQIPAPLLSSVLIVQHPDWPAIPEGGIAGRLPAENSCGFSSADPQHPSSPSPATI